MFDVTDIPNIRIGDEVTLIGKVKNQEIKVEDIANYIGTITYEVVCNLNKRVPRIYIR